MKRKTLACMFLVGTAISTPAFGATIEVRSGQSIQDAVDRARAGDEVVVDDGTYGAFEISKNGISVRARNPGGAHVVASGNNQPAIAAYSQSDIAVRGFRLTSRNGDGVKIGGDASGPLAKNIIFEGNTTEYAKLDGFKFFHSDGITMRNNVIKMAGGGGAAGSGGNSNGDGGIDWVRVSNSLMEENTVQQTNGWACAMVKNGSNNNRIINNRFNNCEVNGIDMAAGSSGRSAAANTSGMTAYNNTIEGNTVDGGKGCAVKFGQKTRGNQLGENDINGRQCDKGTGNNGVAAGADKDVGAEGYGGSESEGGDYPAASGGRENPSQFDRNANRLEENFFNTDEQFWRSLERGEAGATRRFNDLVSGGILFREGNKVINRATGEVTQLTSGAIRDTVDSVMDPIEDYAEDTVGGVVDSIKCNVGGSIMGGGAGIISGIFGGGRATLAAQISQQMTAVAGNLCMGKQLAEQRRMREEMKLMRKGLSRNASGPLESLENGVRSTLGSIDGAIYSPEGADADLQETYQNGMDDDWTYETSWGQSEKIREKTAAAAREAARVNATTQAGISEALAVSDEIMALSQGAEGQTQAIQANTQMARTLISIQAMQHGAQASTANAALRAEEERRALDIIAEQKVKRFYARNEAPPAPTGRALFQ